VEVEEEGIVAVLLEDCGALVDFANNFDFAFSLFSSIRLICSGVKEEFRAESLVVAGLGSVIMTNDVTLSSKRVHATIIVLRITSLDKCREVPS